MDSEYIDTHCHLDGEEFIEDRAAVVRRAREAGCAAVLVPAVDVKSCDSVMEVCRQFAGYCFPMLGLHPEEVRADWREQLSAVRERIDRALASHDSAPVAPLVAIGEVGLDYYWSREYEKEQLLAFEEQVRWSVELGLPLMIHCRKAQNEMVGVLRRYKEWLPGGVFHCFTGNGVEARQLLEFERFALGIGGVLTFKKSRLPEVLSESVPLDRIVLETDAPYMAPVPLRGQRNEPAFIRHVIGCLAEACHVTEEEVCKRTSANARRVLLKLSITRGNPYRE